MSFKNKFREWLSDNLRYLLLGLGILIVVAAIFFGVWFLTSAMNKDKETGSKETSQKENIQTTSASEKETDAETSSGSNTDKEELSTLEANGNAELSALMNQYYTALGGKNIDVLKSLVDNLSGEEQTSITAEPNIEGYEEIVSYTFPGQEDGTYVVIASYNTKYKDIETRAPGLSQMYVYTDTDGKLVIAAEVKDETIKTYMNDIQNQPEVRQLIQKTQADYEAARASDAKLDALINSVTGS
ncbi:hypothetical protein [Novisyntrophococcus fermenticellae]|uniref:hypothetical protein n=1 Tax=Novisyntrophococcus fermenticellae TaxID=2068655 RepID=UPI001E36CD16|nr:hypothetical protein [Novisyntrophococcus fermenticellae]